ncbi:MAG: thioredoxin family protein [Bacteroidota bacterium]
MFKTTFKTVQAVLALIFLSNLLIGQTFQHNIDEAKKIATENNRPIALVFSGSDWCKPCIQMRSTILEDDTFVDFANRKLVLMEVDFPYKKANRLPKKQRAQNEKLADQYNPKGTFPLIVLTDAQGEVKGEFSYDQRLSVDQYIQHIETIMAN